jgi:hypothetical protein
VQTVGIGLCGKGGVPGVRIRFAFKSGEQIFNGLYGFHGDGWHCVPFPGPFRA